MDECVGRLATNVCSVCRTGLHISNMAQVISVWQSHIGPRGASIFVSKKKIRSHNKTKILNFRLLDESPRWLIQHQKITAATKVLNRINHLNRRNFKIEELKQLMAGNPTQKLKISHHSICYLFSKKILAIRVSVLAISW